MYGAPVGTIQLVSGTGGSGYLITSTNSVAGLTPLNPPMKVFHVSLTSGTTASVLQLLNGQGGSVVATCNGTASKGAEFDFGFHGKSFPLGAYVSIDTNMTSGSVDCRSDLL